jgi:hypothetical protein
MNPLIGQNRETLGPRFPPMSDAYDFELRKQAFRSARELGFEKGVLKEGVYAWVRLVFAFASRLSESSLLISDSIALDE